MSWRSVATEPAGAQEALVVVFSSEASSELAEGLAAALLERGLVACVSLLPVRSLYHWQGRLERSEEVKLILKTRPALLEDLQRALLELHSYETPEWIVLPAESSGDYATWIRSVLGPPPPATGPGKMEGAGAG